MGFATWAARALLLLVVAIAAVTAVDGWYAGESFMRQGRPHITAYFAIRSVVAAALAVAFVTTIYRHRDKASTFETGAWGTTGGMFVAVCVVVLAVGLSILLTGDPPMFSAFSREDAVIEGGSALLLLAGSAMLIIAAGTLAARGRGQRTGMVPALLRACFSSSAWKKFHGSSAFSSSPRRSGLLKSTIRRR